MYWRREKGGKAWHAVKGEPNRYAFMSLLIGGKMTGTIALAKDRPIGWCCIGPKRSFSRFQRSRVFAGPSEKGTWSVVCFYIAQGWRRQGIATRLLEGAIDLARAHDAEAIEAYPAKQEECQSLVPAFAWTGIASMFAKAGFRRSPRNNRIWLLGLKGKRRQ